MMLRKIPLETFIEILTNLFNSGADFIDLEGDENDNGETPRDTLKITVRPEYLCPEEDDEDNEEESSSSLSDDDIEDLI